jgi:hypothetical protein
MSDARTVITNYLNLSLSGGGQGWTTQQHADAIIAALADAGLRVVPLVSTAAMYKAFHSVDCLAGVDVRLLFEKRYRAMVEAANEQ